MRMSHIAAFAAGLMISGAGSVAFAQENGASAPTAPAPQQGSASGPTCDHSYGTVALIVPDRNWRQLETDEPTPMLTRMTSGSNCFTVVDRNAHPDYRLEAEIISHGENEHQGAIGGLWHALASGIVDVNKMQATVSLTLRDKHGTELFDEEGHGTKRQVDVFSGPNAGGAYQRAFNDAYGKLLTDLQHRAPPRASEAQAAAAPASATVPDGAGTLVVIRAGHLFEAPSAKSKVLEALAAGTALRETGATHGSWKRVHDRAGQAGWVAASIAVPER